MKRSTMGASRGFTLVELVVAMSAGVLVAIAALLLAKNASTFFQHEARISGAQLAASLGMTRLTADLQRAAYLSTRNNQNDPRLCADGVVLPPGIKDLAGVQIRVNGSEADHPSDFTASVSAGNDLHPDSIVIGGSLATAEEFVVDLPQQGAANDVNVHGDADPNGGGAIRRIRAQASKSGQTLEAALASILMPGRFLRVLDPLGNAMYGVIRGHDVIGKEPSETITIHLDPTPSWVYKPAAKAATCGVTGLGAGKDGIRASVVYRVRYDIQSLAKHPKYGALVAFDPKVAAVSGEDTRTELVRVELDENGAAIPGSLELVAEFAVDLKFGITASGAGLNPTMMTHPFGAKEVDTGATAPELIRAVQVRLSTRTRAPDRDVKLGSGEAVPYPYRFAVRPGPGAPRFARIRTLVTNVNLLSQGAFVQ
jgi:type II secretory pathway pseudopilin PulG